MAGSGAFVMEGTAYITAATIQAGGTTGFSAWTDATVTFAPAKDDDIQVTADSTGLAVEKGGELSVTIEGGTFQSTNESGGNKNGIWYGNGNAKLTITGGQFTGSDGSGLFFGAEPSGSNVQLSGGTYYGSNGAINANSPGSISTGNILGDNTVCYQEDTTNQSDAICSREYNYDWARTYHYTQIGRTSNGNNNADLNENVYYNGPNRIAFNRLTKIVLKTATSLIEYDK